MNNMKEVFPNNAFFMDVTYFQLVLRVLACITVRGMLPATFSSPPPLPTLTEKPRVIPYNN